MRITRVLSIGAMILVMALSAPCQHPKIDQAFLGFWSLEIAKSDFAGQPTPKMGQVNWGEHGWAFALVLADGQAFTDGISTDGCAYIGVSRLSCVFEVVTPRHVRLTLMEGKTVRRIGDIELLGNDITQTTHRVIPSNGEPYVEKAIWARQK